MMTFTLRSSLGFLALCGTLSHHYGALAGAVRASMAGWDPRGRAGHCLVFAARTAATVQWSGFGGSPAAADTRCLAGFQCTWSLTLAHESLPLLVSVTDSVAGWGLLT